MRGSEVDYELLYALDSYAAADWIFSGPISVEDND
jgi:hypothetical protein